MWDWKDASLLLVGHGSSSYPAAADDLQRLAGQIRDRALFDRVDVAFWRQDPFISDACLQGARIFVLPYFAGVGKHTEQLIPEILGLTGTMTVRTGQQILYCPPIGCHPRLPDLILRRALATTAAPRETALLLIAHGSSQGGASRTPEAIAECLRTKEVFAEIVTVYLEQSPFAAEWPSLVKARQIVAQPLLLAAGMHVSDDIPPLFGMTAQSSSPADCHGFRIWLRQGIGEDSEIVAMLLDQVALAGEFT